MFAHLHICKQRLTLVLTRCPWPIETTYLSVLISSDDLMHNIYRQSLENSSLSNDELLGSEEEAHHFGGYYYLFYISAQIRCKSNV